MKSNHKSEVMAALLAGVVGLPFASGMFAANPSPIFIDDKRSDKTSRITPRLNRLAKTYRFKMSPKARAHVEMLIKRETEHWNDHPDEWQSPCWCRTCRKHCY